MARPRKIATERLIDGTKRYFEDICKGDTKMLKYAQIAAYLSTLYNIPIADYDLKKSSELKEYIATLKNSGNKQLVQKNIYFKRLDVDNFLRTNNTAASLKKALIELDSHYEQISKAAECIMEENRRLITEQAALRQENTSLVSINQRLTTNTEIEQPNILELKNKIKEQEHRIKMLVKIIEDNVYPQIANHLLAETGFIKTKNSGISEKGNANIMQDTDSIQNLIHELNDF